jgi:hypothetical protein
MQLQTEPQKTVITDTSQTQTQKDIRTRLRSAAYAILLRRTDGKVEFWGRRNYVSNQGDQAMIRSENG